VKEKKVGTNPDVIETDMSPDADAEEVANYLCDMLPDALNRSKNVFGRRGTRANDAHRKSDNMRWNPITRVGLCIGPAYGR
jgi:hypothetical protein